MTESRNYNPQQLFRWCIKSLAAILGEDYGDATETERLLEHTMMTPLLNEMSESLERMPDIYCDWFDIPRDWTFADFADHIRETDARILASHVGVVYGYLTTIDNYYETGSSEDRQLVEEIVTYTASIHGACTDRSDLMLLTKEL
jgi:hypothetical protein